MEHGYNLQLHLRGILWRHQYGFQSIYTFQYWWLWRHWKVQKCIFTVHLLLWLLSFSRYFCETLLDFHDPCPVKEQLRNKIVGRLLKEGSNADEPANIALSDYSSLSSGCESSSCDEDVVKNNKNADGDDEDAEEAIAAAEERKRVRKLRSRRDRSKNGAQFTQTLYPDFRQVSSFDKILFFLFFIAFFFAISFCAWEYYVKLLLPLLLLFLLELLFCDKGVFVILSKS